MFLRSRACALIASVSIAVVGSIVATTGPAVAATDAWTVAFRDDFSGTGLPNPDNWQLTLGSSYPGGPDAFGTGEIERNTEDRANVDVHDGQLYITPQRDATGQWTSARVETKRADLKAPTGGVMRVDGRIQMPNVTGNAALGYWPAFWMLGSPYRANPWSWPGIGEFDIMEDVQGLNKSWGTLHCGTWGGPCTEPEGISNNGITCPGATCQSAFHVFSFEWDRTQPVEEMRWYVDDHLTHTVKESAVPAETWAAMTDHAGYFMILNVAMGGAFPNKLADPLLGGGPVSVTQPGVPMIVDYVQVAYRGGGGTVPTTQSTAPATGTTPTATTAPVTRTTPTVTTTAPPTTTTQATTTTTHPSTPTSGHPNGSSPSNLHVVGTTTNSVTLGWNGVAASSYDVLRSGVRIGTVTGTTFTDAGLFKNTPYVYSVRGNGLTTPEITAVISNNPGTSTTVPTNTVPTNTGPGTTATTGATVPTGSTAGPSNLHVTGTTASTVTLGWNGSAGGRYDVLRSGVPIGTVVGTTFTDVGLFKNTPYLYSVRGYGTTTAMITATIT